MKEKNDIQQIYRRSPFFKLACFYLTLIILIGISGCTPSGNESIVSSSGPVIIHSPDTFISADTPHYSSQKLEFYQADNVGNISYQSGTLTKDGWALWIVATLDDGSATSNPTRNNIILFYDSTGLQTGQIDLSTILPADVMVSGITSNPDGIIYLLTSEVSEMGTGDYDVYMLDSSGVLLGEPTAITIPENLYPTQMVVDKAGNMYIACYEACIVFDLYGELLYTIEDPSLTGKIFRVNDNVYVSASPIESHKSLLYPLDNAQKNLGTPIDLSSFSVEGFSADGKSFYITSANGIESLDLGNNEKTSLFLWNNVSFVSAGSRNELIVLSGSSILCLSTADGSFSTLEMYLFTKDQTNPDTGKIILTLAGLDISYDVALQTAIIAFNQSSTEYKIIPKDYADDIDFSLYSTPEEIDAAREQMIRQINLEILSGKGPDIIYGNYYMPLSAYEDNGILVDLNTLIEKDSTFNKDNYLENILSLSERDGHLYKMPAAFFTRGLYGPKSIIGDRTGWTVEEFDAMASSLPDSILPLPGLTQSSILEQSLSSSLDVYIDETTGQVNFDVESFYQLLDYAKTYGFIDLDSALALTEDPYWLMKNDGLALLHNHMYGPLSFIEEEAYAGESISIVGYPSPDSSGPPCYISKLLAISVQSSHSDAAWEFIKIFLGEDVQEATADHYGIPVLKTQFEAQIEKAMYPSSPEYLMISEIEITAMTTEQAQEYRDFIYGLDTLAYQDREIIAIILEEVPAYFYDQKSAEDVVALMENRIQTLVDERA
jgi:multiple sugar transport system substrate-binding protein